MTEKSILRIGTRKSPLAMKQAEMVRGELLKAFPALQVELVPMMTTGDMRTDRALSEIGGKGLFTKELEESLADGRVDMAVHSLKDMETKIREGMVLAAMLLREDARDALIAPGSKTIANLHKGSRIGTSSLRRMAQIKLIRPDIEIVPLRGNVQTRLDKLARGEADATLLAVAGLVRLGLEHVITERLNGDDFIPAVGQGIIGIECRADDEEMVSMLKVLNHVPTWGAGLAERSLLAKLDGSCRTPIAAHAEIEGGVLHLRAFVAKPDGTHPVRGERRGAVEDAQKIGNDLAKEMLANGARKCLT